MPNLRGEITEAPPVYTFFRSRTDLILWAVSVSVIMGTLVFPFLMMGGTDVVLYIGGLSMLCYMGWQFYTQYQLNKELDEITKETQ